MPYARRYWYLSTIFPMILEWYSSIAWLSSTGSTRFAKSMCHLCLLAASCNVWKRKSSTWREARCEHSGFPQNFEEDQPSTKKVKVVFNKWYISCLYFKHPHAGMAALQGHFQSEIPDQSLTLVKSKQKTRWYPWHLVLVFPHTLLLSLLFQDAASLPQTLSWQELDLLSTERCAHEGALVCILGDGPKGVLYIKEPCLQSLISWGAWWGTNIRIQCISWMSRAEKRQKTVSNSKPLLCMSWR